MHKYFTHSNTPYGGQYVPETLMPALYELEEAYEKFKKDADAQKKLQHLLREYAGRPTPLTTSPRPVSRAGPPPRLA